MNDSAILTIQQPGHGLTALAMENRKPLIWTDVDTEENNEND